ncbi:MAG: hypothetical protein KW806_01680 [Candidatus Yanofskybacteria bacterium]|nr:hypothetical protein [Candidatus Yanofskybacteria bacterium]
MDSIKETILKRLSEPPQWPLLCKTYRKVQEVKVLEREAKRFLKDLERLQEVPLGIPGRQRMENRTVEDFLIYDEAREEAQIFLDRLRRRVRKNNISPLALRLIGA